MEQIKPDNPSSLNPARRSLLSLCGIAALLTGSRSVASTIQNQQAHGKISQPDDPGPKAFVERAFEMRDLAASYGDQSYGAVVVYNNIIVGQSWSRVIIDQDPSAHAEMSAIRDAAQRLKSRHLSDMILYSSSRPCPMCEAAAYWAGIAQMIYGPQGSNAGPPELCG